MPRHYVYRGSIRRYYVDQHNFMYIIHVCRHRFVPKELILNFLDAMSYVKMNVFHWHISDVCIFSIESKVYVLFYEHSGCTVA